MQISERRIYFW